MSPYRQNQSRRKHELPATNNSLSPLDGSFVLEEPICSNHNDNDRHALTNGGLRDTKNIVFELMLSDWMDNMLDSGHLSDHNPCCRQCHGKAEPCMESSFVCCRVSAGVTAAKGYVLTQVISICCEGDIFC